MKTKEFCKMVLELTEVKGTFERSAFKLRSFEDVIESTKTLLERRCENPGELRVDSLYEEFAHRK